ncbi:MAG: hypothetical protein N2C14_29435 [Planctomycetales bacterium]
MMKFRSLLCCAFCLVAAVALIAADKESKFSATCFISGKPAKEASSAEYKGGKVYFCCNNCPKAFKANTAKFATKANHQLVATGQAKQTACPIAGRKLNPATAITVNGAKVAFCCNGCKGKASKATGDTQLTLLFGKSFDKSFKVAKAKE